MTTLDAIVTVSAAAIASGGTYWAVRRTKSGKIDTTEAGTLWLQAEAMRKELRDEVVDLKEQLREARSEIVVLRGRLENLEAK